MKGSHQKISKHFLESYAPDRTELLRALRVLDGEQDIIAMGAAVKSSRSRTPRKSFADASVSKTTQKANASILNFFSKAQKTEDSLFVGVSIPPPVHGPDSTVEERERFNEANVSVKRRRMTFEPGDYSNEVEQDDDSDHPQPVKSEQASRNGYSGPSAQTVGPFIMESDSEWEGNSELERAYSHQTTLRQSEQKAMIELDQADDVNKTCSTKTPPSIGQDDSVDATFEELRDFQDFNELDLDDFEGEEMRERRFMQEQVRLEAEEASLAFADDLAEESPYSDQMTECCPICNGSFSGVSASDAMLHVNSCLDGNPTSLPKSFQKEKMEPCEIESAEISKRFARAAVPRPVQANPFELDTKDQGQKSAFSKLMSNNAEDLAWVSAAAAEHASRGKPAYERTCPFYKIMPGFNICVDAFRYGAVEGCKAYFLSHFHSDHYVGLTANWRHGPIYCSKVTGSLVKQQLGTAAQWVVQLEFEKTYDIPGTGATVTMIPANHCPGSSLFVFEKSLMRNERPRTQRILHCGDFRACSGHVGHPLLKPDVQDSITGKVKQQVINLCYLNTTYLNPRYSFPPQEDVIKACADLCASVSPNPDCEDIWERSQQAAGEQPVSKFFRSNKADGTTVSEVEASGNKARQRLLVICGTYSIGKERICIAIAKALGSKIFATPSKRRLCKQLDIPELTALLTSNPIEAQVHMQSLMEIRAETLQNYLNGYKSHFSRIVGFRPTGWNFRGANGKPIAANTSPSSIPMEHILHDRKWRSRFGYTDFVPQRGSTKQAMCFGVPYSEHSSFRELAMFLMSVRIEKVIPTVNVGSEQSRKRMKGWIDRWMAERRRGGFTRPLLEAENDFKADDVELWDGKSGKGAVSGGRPILSTFFCPVCITKAFEMGL